MRDHLIVFTNGGFLIWLLASTDSFCHLTYESLLLHPTHCSVGIVLLGIINLLYVALFFAVDVGFYLSLKMIRDDLIYWMPATGFSSLFVSIFLRIVNKLVTDFTGVLQFRHPNEVGGAVWSFSQFTSISMLYVALDLVAKNGMFSRHMESLWWMCVGLTFVAVSAFAIFLSLINPGYIRTFFR